MSDRDTCSEGFIDDFIVGSFLQIQSRNLLFLIYWPENTTMKGLSEAEEKAQRYYQACMNEAKIEELGAKPLQELISQVFPKAIRHQTHPSLEPV